jgi:hypothetical protein
MSMRLRPSPTNAICTSRLARWFRHALCAAACVALAACFDGDRGPGPAVTRSADLLVTFPAPACVEGVLRNLPGISTVSRSDRSTWERVEYRFVYRGPGRVAGMLTYLRLTDRGADRLDLWQETLLRDPSGLSGGRCR